MQVLNEAVAIMTTEALGKTKETQEMVGLTLKEGPTTEIMVELGFTKNLGDYQSARFHVSLKAPSNLDTDSLDKTYEFVKGWCDNKMGAMIDEFDKDMANGKS